MDIVTLSKLSAKLSELCQDYIKEGNLDYGCANKALVLMNLKNLAWDSVLGDPVEAENKIREKYMSSAIFTGPNGTNPAFTNARVDSVKKCDKEIKELHKDLEWIKHYSPSEWDNYLGKDARTVAYNARIKESLLNIRASAFSGSYDDSIVESSLKTIQDCYGFSDWEIAVLVKWLCQIKHRLAFCEDYDNYCDNKSIMLSLWSPIQGSGKTEFSRILTTTINSGNRKSYDIDFLLGDHGTLDIFQFPAIWMDEMGRQRKDTTDLLKNIITAGDVTVNRKYETPITKRAFASLILTSNDDPSRLFGTEIKSRRICPIFFSLAKPTKTLAEIEEAVEALWRSLGVTPDTLERITGYTDESLTAAKVADDIKFGVADWYASLSEEGKDWLENHYRFTCGSAYQFFHKDGNVYSKTQMRDLLDSGYFDSVHYESNNCTYYSVNKEKLTELMKTE